MDINIIVMECPVNDWHCAYFDNGDCMLGHIGKDPIVECSYIYDRLNEETKNE